MTDSENNTTSYEYDQADRLISETNQLGLTVSYQYDGVSNLVSMTDRNDRTTTFTYDDLNRLTQEVWLNDGNVIDYEYDAASRLVSVEDDFSSYQYTYDEDDRLTSVDNLGTVGVPNVVLEYTYDDVGNLLSVTDTIAGVVSGVESFIHDELNRVISISQSGNGVTDKRVDFDYDEASQLIGIDRFNDLAGTQLVAETDYTYDNFGRLVDLVHGNTDGEIASYNWVYDQANRITRFTSPDGVADYDYDNRDQLVSADYDYQDDENYSYDGVGNRTNDGYQTGVNNRLLSDDVYNYTYDGEGNRISRTEIATGEVTEYQWDYRNRLVAVITKDSDGNIIERSSYTYDVYDRRISKLVENNTLCPLTIELCPFLEEGYVHDGDEIALVFDGDGNLIERFLHGVTVDQVLAQENADGSVYWGLADNLGSIRYVLDNDGNVINSITYNAFGEITNETDPSVDFRFGYTGREFDEETGQYYYRARYFDAPIGRFISEDTIGFAGGDTNLYRYVGNNATNYIDPTGNSALQVSAILSAGISHIIGELLFPEPAYAPTGPCDRPPVEDNTLNKAAAETITSALADCPDLLFNTLKNLSKLGDDAAKALLNSLNSLDGVPVLVEGVENTLKNADNVLRQNGVDNLDPSNLGVGVDNLFKPFFEATVDNRINIAKGQTKSTPLRSRSGQPVSAGFEDHVLKQITHFSKKYGRERSLI